MDSSRRPDSPELASLLERFAHLRSPEDVVETCLGAAREAGAYRSGVFVRDGDVIELAGESGYAPEQRGLFQRLGLAARLPVCDAIREQRPVWIESREQLQGTYPELILSPSTRPELAVAVLPLMLEGRTLGALHVNYPGAHRFSEEERWRLAFLALQCAQALERTRLLAEAEAAHRRLELLAQTGKALAEARLDPAKVLQAITRLITGSIADACVLALLTDGGRALRPVAFGHRRPEALAAMRPPLVDTPCDELLAGEVLRSGEPLRIPVVDRAALSAWRRTWIDPAGLRSVLIVPIRSDTQPLGALSVLRDADPRPFTASDEALLQEVAHQASLAIDAAYHFQQADTSRRRLEAVIQQMPSAVSIVEAPSGRQLLHNDQNDRIFRFPVHAVRGIDDYGRFVGYHADGREYGADEWPMARSLRTGEVVQGEEIEILRGDGTRGFISVRSAPIRDAAGEIVAGVVILDDVTARKQAEILLLSLTKELEDRVSALERARAEAERANRAKDEFLAMLGHELRNPLAPMLSALELMRLRAGGGALPYEGGIIERQVLHMVRLVDDLLDVSRITGGKIQLAHEPVEVAALVAHAVEMIQPLLDQRSHALRVEVPSSGLLLHADPARMAQAIANLLNNAARYTPPRGNIEVAARRDGADVVISVKDDGAGIAPDLLPRLFDMFVQGKRTLDRAEGGLGLGLTIAKSLVELHGGTVQAQSGGAGAGTELTVRVPAIERAGAAAPTPAPPKPSPLAPRRVLVVDDNRDAADMLTELLLRAGYVTKVAYDGLSALSLAASFLPEAVVLDIGLPGIDGYELTRRLRRLSGLELLRVIALTGYGQDHDRARSAEAGATAHLVKPVNFKALLDALRSALKAGPS